MNLDDLAKAELTSTWKERWIADQLSGVLAAMADARAEGEIDSALILTAQRHRTQAAALELFELAQPWADSILGFGLGAAERGNPPAKFADYYALCRERGFRTTIHAGEDGPASYVREALDVCHPDRIDHGVAAAGDPALVARLRDGRPADHVPAVQPQPAGRRPAGRPPAAPHSPPEAQRALRARARL